MSIAAAAWLVAACHDNEDSSTCRSGIDCGTTGGCRVAKNSGLTFCTVAAPGCETGERWAESAGDELAGHCFDPVMVDAGVQDADAVQADATSDVGGGR